MQLSTNGKIMRKVYGQHIMESVGYTVKTLMNVTIPAKQGSLLLTCSPGDHSSKLTWGVGS